MDSADGLDPSYYLTLNFPLLAEQAWCNTPPSFRHVGEMTVSHRKLRRMDITALLRPSRHLLVALILSLGQLIVGSMDARAQEKRIVIGYVERDLNNLPPLVAEAKGYFREAGFATQIVQVRTVVSTAAILSGAIDYHTSFASTIQRAMQGAPLRGLLTMVERPNFYLVSRPEIRTVADLRGKIVGVGSLGSINSIIAQQVLAHHGIFGPLREAQAALGIR
jgi:ABC-type nitrate/sulfonate/bicarbonate transport system substrate-binding protein